ncbi:hypothetical protein PCL_09016 [Purpureocillium lilacinum]|uniref:Uncharacterized protein n=1 Tax=Purpureocillium lilacinum TaxID=33203 RepID=A0A2U3EH25_PURLI|nr:hypothetical protein PCL_09016 [Purpureocillium lilacinum]
MSSGGRSVGSGVSVSAAGGGALLTARAPASMDPLDDGPSPCPASTLHCTVGCFRRGIHESIESCPDLQVGSPVKIAGASVPGRGLCRYLLAGRYFYLRCGAPGCLLAHNSPQCQGSRRDALRSWVSTASCAARRACLSGSPIAVPFAPLTSSPPPPQPPPPPLPLPAGRRHHHHHHPPPGCIFNTASPPREPAAVWPPTHTDTHTPYTHAPNTIAHPSVLPPRSSHEKTRAAIHPSWSAATGARFIPGHGASQFPLGPHPPWSILPPSWLEAPFWRRRPPLPGPRILPKPTPRRLACPPSQRDTVAPDDNPLLLLHPLSAPAIGRARPRRPTTDEQRPPVQRSADRALPPGQHHGCLGPPSRLPVTGSWPPSRHRRAIGTLGGGSCKISPTDRPRPPASQGAQLDRAVLKPTALHCGSAHAISRTPSFPCASHRPILPSRFVAVGPAFSRRHGILAAGLSNTSASAAPECDRKTCAA